MGSVLYDFLADSILFNDDAIINEYSDLSDSQLEKVLDDYRNHCLSNIEELTNEVSMNKSSLKVLSSIEKIPYKILKQSALYFDQFIIYDPLFPFTSERNKSTDAWSKFLGYKGNKINRKSIVDAVKLLKAITPMIAADFVKVLPLSKAFEAPKDIPITFSENYFADSLPKEIMNFCQKNAVVLSMKQADVGWQILDKQDYTPGIYINFKGLEMNDGMTYNYLFQEFEITEDPNSFLAKMTLPEYPMDKATWDIWVYQSINRASIKVVDRIFYEIIMANRFNATYLTDNEFNSNLITQNLSNKESIETYSASQFMNIELPFLDKININKLMLIRNHEADTFTNFRIELERQFRELRTVTDPKEIRLRQENIIHELGYVQVKKINQKLDSLRRKGFAEALILLGGLAGTVQTAGWSLLASALATAQGYKSYREYKDKLVENPSYLLWRVLDKKR